jgi:hypothetical protein
MTAAQVSAQPQKITPSRLIESCADESAGHGLMGIVSSDYALSPEKFRMAFM